MHLSPQGDHDVVLPDFPDCQVRVGSIPEIEPAVHAAIRDWLRETGAALPVPRNPARSVPVGDTVNGFRMMLEVSDHLQTTSEESAERAK